MTPDLINGGLEFASSLLVLVNVRRLLIDKRVAGVSLIPTVLFDLWALWNFYYYSSLNQWWSFTGGVFLAAANITWTGLALYYRRRAA